MAFGLISSQWNGLSRSQVGLAKPTDPVCYQLDRRKRYTKLKVQFHVFKREISGTYIMKSKSKAQK